MSARDKETGQIVEPEELWIMHSTCSVNLEGYECRGCGAPAIPCSFKPHNTPRPYFRVDNHNPDCDVDGEVKLLKRARKQSFSIDEVRDKFPNLFPSSLLLRETRPVTESSDNLSSTNDRVRHNSSASLGSSSVDRKGVYKANTIRPICRTFLGYPYNRRDLPLAIDGIKGKNYQQAFRRLEWSNIISYSGQYIFFAPIDCFRESKSDDEKLEIQLVYGEWEDGKPTRTYRVIVNWIGWSEVKRQSVSREIDTAKTECEKERAKAKKNNETLKKKGWLFFIGAQDESDPAIFQVNDHRLICCIVDEMIYPIKIND